MSRRYVQLDVFAGQPGDGNPLAVVLDGDGLDDATMQAIARWTRLPETTFVFPATTSSADYRLRIFSPRREVPFAGHPSVGTAHGRVATTSSPRSNARALPGSVPAARGTTSLAAESAVEMSCPPRAPDGRSPMARLSRCRAAR